MRVVVVEDDVQLRRVLGIFLRSEGIEVLAEFVDGQEALELLTEVHPDLIVTDCQMPRMDGISLVRHLRERGDQTPVIMMSGQHDPALVRIAMAAGVSQYLPKPLSAVALNLALVQTFPGTAA